MVTFEEEKKFGILDVDDANEAIGAGNVWERRLWLVVVIGANAEVRIVLRKSTDVMAIRTLRLCNNIGGLR